MRTKFLFKYIVMVEVSAFSQLSRLMQQNQAIENVLSRAMDTTFFFICYHLGRPKSYYIICDENYFLIDLI